MRAKPKYSRISALAGTLRCIRERSGGAAEEAVHALGERCHHGQRAQSLITARAAVQRQAAAMQPAQHRAGERPAAGAEVATIDQLGRRFQSANEYRAG